MAWFRVLRNARVGRARYMTGEVVELDPAILAGKTDNFAPCNAPGKPESKPSKEPTKSTKEPKKTAAVIIPDPPKVETTMPVKSDDPVK